MALSPRPPDHWFIRTLRVIVGVPVTWAWLAVAFLANGGEHIATLIVCFAALEAQQGRIGKAAAALPLAALFLLLRYPAKWLLPEIERLQFRVLPTDPHITELPGAAVAPAPAIGSLPVAQAERESILVGLHTHADDVEERPQVLGR